MSLPDVYRHLEKDWARFRKLPACWQKGSFDAGFGSLSPVWTTLTAAFSAGFGLFSGLEWVCVWALQATKRGSARDSIQFAEKNESKVLNSIHHYEPLTLVALLLPAPSVRQLVDVRGPTTVLGNPEDQIAGSKHCWNISWNPLNFNWLHLTCWTLRDVKKQIRRWLWWILAVCFSRQEHAWCIQGQPGARRRAFQQHVRRCHCAISQSLGDRQTKIYIWYVYIRI